MVRITLPAVTTTPSGRSEMTTQDVLSWTEITAAPADWPHAISLTPPSRGDLRGQANGAGG